MSLHVPTACLLAAGLALLVPPAASQVPQFSAPTGYSTDDYDAEDIAVTDLNGDGILDLAVANGGLITSPGSVSVLLGSGGGAFSPPTTFDVGGHPNSIAAGDLDGDGLPDLAVVNVSSANSLYVLWGTGAGNFGAPTSYALGGPSVTVALGDLDADGDLDVVAGLPTPGSFSVLPNQGGGVLGPAVSHDAGVSPHSLAVLDMNGDGTLDVVVASAMSGVVTVALGQGGGVFAAPIGYPLAFPQGGAGSLAVGDVDGDGLLDAVTANSALVTVVLGTGGGALGTPMVFLSGSNTVHVTLADITGDGLLDACTSRTPGFVSVLPGLGGGQLGPFVAFPAGPTCRSAAVGDFDGDGAPDLAVANGTTTTPYPLGGVSILLNETAGDGSWTDLGSGLAGVSGTPELAGTGTLEAEAPGMLALSSAAPSAPAILFISLASTPAPFKGGTLLTVPVAVALALATDPGGGLLLPFAWPSGVPSATSLFFQCAIQDAVPAQGVSLSNAQLATTP